MNEDLRPDPEEAVEFLEKFQPGGPWAITHATADWKDVRTEWLASPAEVRAFVEENWERGLFYTVARLQRGVTSKPTKEQLVDVRHFHLDLDPPKGMDPSGFEAWLEEKCNEVRGDETLRPSYIGCSGSGLHLLWTLNEPFLLGGPAQVEDVECYNAGRLEAFGQDSDGTWNADRLLRLPGSINWPNAKKRKDGRKPSPAYIVEFNARDYERGDFMPSAEHPAAKKGRPGKKAAAAERGELRRLANPAELDQWTVPPWALAVIVHGTDPEEPDRWDGDRSRAVFAVCCELLRRGVPAELIVGIITDKSWDISAHVLDQRRPVDYAWSQVEKARARVAEGSESFQTDKDGKPYANQHNIRLAVKKLGVRVRLDLFANRPLIEGLDGFGPHLDDAGMTRLWLLVDEVHRIKATKDFFWSVVEDAARREAFHPIVEYFDGLGWDGVPRVDGWLSTYMGAEPSDYTRHVGSILLTAAVRRVRSPGCKFDEMVILESEQGKDKSTALNLLAVREEWFSDDLPLGADAKVVIERTEGRWIVEAAELTGMSKKEVENLKAFLSRRIDRSRMAWGRLAHEAPRQFVVIGTTNKDKYLRDTTGNRRFWPVRIGEIDVEALRRDRDQLWAEAAAREAAGASIRLDRQFWQAAVAEQEERRQLDPFVIELAAVFRELPGKVPSKDVWQVIGTPVGLRTPDLESRLGEAMKELGFARKQLRFGGGPEYAYVRGSGEEQKRRIVLRMVMDEEGGSGRWVAKVEGSGEPQHTQEPLDLDQPY